MSVALVLIITSTVLVGCNRRQVEQHVGVQSDQDFDRMKSYFSKKPLGPDERLGYGSVAERASPRGVWLVAEYTSSEADRLAVAKAKKSFNSPDETSMFPVGIYRRGRLLYWVGGGLYVAKAFIPNKREYARLRYCVDGMEKTNL